MSFQLNKKAHELECVFILLINLVIDFELSLVYLIIQSKYRERNILKFYPEWAIYAGGDTVSLIHSNSQ